MLGPVTVRPDSSGTRCHGGTMGAPLLHPGHQQHPAPCWRIRRAHITKGVQQRARVKLGIKFNIRSQGRKYSTGVHEKYICEEDMDKEACVGRGGLGRGEEYSFGPLGYSCLKISITVLVVWHIPVARSLCQTISSVYSRERDRGKRKKEKKNTGLNEQTTLKNAKKSPIFIRRADYFS